MDFGELTIDELIDTGPTPVQYLKHTFTWHLLNKNKGDAIYYVSSFLKTNRNNDQFEQCWFPLPENPGNEESHTPIQQQILRELRNLQEAERVNPNDNEESRRKFLSNFDWKDSMQQQHEIKRIESLLVELHEMFSRHRFDNGMNEEFTVKLTQKDDSPAYSQSFANPVNWDAGLQLCKQDFRL